LAQLAPYIDENHIIWMRGRLRFSGVSHDAKYPTNHHNPHTSLSWSFAIIICHSCTMDQNWYCRCWIKNIGSCEVVRQFDSPFLHVFRAPVIGCPPPTYCGWLTVIPSPTSSAFFTRRYGLRRSVPRERTSPPKCTISQGLFSNNPSRQFTSKLRSQHRRLPRGPRSFCCPSNIYSDCGTNYAGAARQLRTLFRDTKSQDHLLSHLDCIWHFNPSATPHFDGIWEAGIKSVNFHLKHVIGQ
jgi:hypothetical protein